MNTKFTMQLVAVFLFVLGIGFLFLPNEIIKLFKFNPDSLLVLILQFCGGLYIGFAILNWMLRGQYIGGIYSRSLVLANLVHFLVGALSFIKIIFKTSLVPVVWIVGLFYVVFAITFSVVLLKNPKQITSKING